MARAVQLCAAHYESRRSDAGNFRSTYSRTGKDPNMRLHRRKMDFRFSGREREESIKIFSVAVTLISFKTIFASSRLPSQASKRRMSSGLWLPSCSNASMWFQRNACPKRIRRAARISVMQPRQSTEKQTEARIVQVKSLGSFLNFKFVLILTTLFSNETALPRASQQRSIVRTSRISGHIAKDALLVGEQGCC